MKTQFRIHTRTLLWHFKLGPPSMRKLSIMGIFTIMDTVLDLERHDNRYQGMAS